MLLIKRLKTPAPSLCIHRENSTKLKRCSLNSVPPHPALLGSTGSLPLHLDLLLYPGNGKVDLLFGFLDRGIAAPKTDELAEFATFDGNAVLSTERRVGEELDIPVHWTGIKLCPLVGGRLVIVGRYAVELLFVQQPEVQKTLRKVRVWWAAWHRVERAQLEPEFVDLLRELGRASSR